MTEIQIKTTLFVLYLAGTETTSALLTYMLWQLGRHPEYQEEIFDEIGEQKSDLSLYDLANSLETVGKFFTESIRLFTPLFVFGRATTQDVICTTEDREGNELSQTFIAKGKSVVASPTFSGRDPNEFDDPDTFNPHRFEHVSKSFPWLPFGHGAHSCPGRWIAKEEATLLLTEIVRTFRVSSSPNKITQKGYLTLKLGEEIRLSLTPRQAH